MNIMKTAVMQPYLFPYVGYFQLIHSVDEFVVFDDVNYIKQGWINRNRILLDKKEFLITLQLSGASSFKLINQVEVGLNQNKFLKTIGQAYKKAPYFQSVYPIIKAILLNSEKNLAKFIEGSLYHINNYLGITSEIVISSELAKNNELKNQDKVINICELIKAKYYINAIGGRALYSRESFLEKGIELKFIKSKSITYKQFDNKFIPNLSIIDVMMFNSKADISKMLQEYSLV